MRLLGIGSAAALIVSIIYLRLYPLVLVAVLLAGVIGQFYRPAAQTLVTDLTPPGRAGAHPGRPGHTTHNKTLGSHRYALRNINCSRDSGDAMPRSIVVVSAGSALAVAVLAGCTSAHGAGTAATARKAAAQAGAHLRQLCTEQVSWERRGEASVKALYADTGALAADASASNFAGVTKAGRKLSSDAIAAATLPLPPLAQSSWKALTTDYAAAGSAIAAGHPGSAVPELEAGNSAISAFSTAVGKCPGLDS